MIKYQRVNLVLSVRIRVNEACNALGFCIFSRVTMIEVLISFSFQVSMRHMAANTLVFHLPPA